MSNKKSVVDKNSVPAQKGEKKATLHPNYRSIEVIMTDGEVFKTRSTFPSGTLKLDIDIKTHPAWTREANYINSKASEVAKFNEKFGGLSFLNKQKAN